MLELELPQLDCTIYGRLKITIATIHMCKYNKQSETVGRIHMYLQELSSDLKLRRRVAVGDGLLSQVVDGGEDLPHCSRDDPLLLWQHGHVEPCTHRVCLSATSLRVSIWRHVQDIDRRMHQH